MQPDKINRAFEALRKAEPEIPLEKVEQFVIASVATGVASASFFSKFAIKFHLNTIIAMTTAAAAALTGLLLFMNSHESKTADFAQMKNKPASPVTTNYEEAPSASSIAPLSVDTPSTEVKKAPPATTTSITVTSTNEKSGSTTTTVNAGSGNSVYVNVSPKGEVTTQVFTLSDPQEPGDDDGDVYAAYAYAWNGDSTDTAAAVAEEDETPGNEGQEMAYTNYFGADYYKAMSSLACNHYSDTLPKIIEDALIKDGLITDRKQYTFSFTGKKLMVNGKEQPHDTWERYRQLIVEHSDYRVNKHFEYQINVNRNNETININNGD